MFNKGLTITWWIQYRNRRLNDREWRLVYNWMYILSTSLIGIDDEGPNESKPWGGIEEFHSFGISMEIQGESDATACNINHWKNCFSLKRNIRIHGNRWGGTCSKLGIKIHRNLVGISKFTLLKGMKGQNICGLRFLKNWVHSILGNLSNGFPFYLYSWSKNDTSQRKSL